ncbi:MULTISPECIES: carbon-nitrogen hydrolase family protein [unclassified Streptomyces]|uniref:carbon-nitrogen hydrolase family protein n=1 Tax=unclassified Streptomyces TaxID=2593676 RepID=UPI001660A54B|nr:MULTISPECIES: carbon-nitrogen hydrolase family protein [unclassified Streptomyces]MBD0708019.1 carbon-nitrogen hydrolase family protein [Streptomyces sp. CBMA291]MBD0715887.1 carbon-nitrogen hydrolase family protein [Streptomyces sp. CBMA370]
MIVAASQFAPAAGDLEANVRTVAELVRSAGAEGARLVVFAELCLTGYEPSLIRETPALVLDEDDPRLDPVREACRAVSAAAVVNGPVRTDDGRPALTTLVIGPDGSLLARYDKQHLHGTEREVFVAGSEDGRFALDGLRFATATCYDNRFPALAERAAADGCAVYLASSVLVTGNDSLENVYPVRARDFGLHVVLGNTLGSNEEGEGIGFSGVWGPDGTRLADAGGVDVGFALARIG